MQRLTYFVATSLDGHIARPDGSFDFFLNEGQHVADYLAALKSFDAVVMGRSTYEIATRAGVNDPYPWLATYVVSKTIAASEEPNVNVLGDDPVGVVRSLKERPGRGIYLCGGGKLAALLLEHDLIDDITIKLNPVIAGDGIPVVAKMDRPTALDLVETKVYESGVVFLHYRVKRSPRTGASG